MNNPSFDYKKFFLITVTALIIMLSINTFIISLITKEPPWKLARIINEKEEVRKMSSWQQYKNEEFNFSFQYPPMTILTECWDKILSPRNAPMNDCALNVLFGTENFRELVAVRNAQAPTMRYFFGVLVKTDPLTGSLREYVERQRDIINRNYVIKDIEIDNVQGSVIESVGDRKSSIRRFFLPLNTGQLLLILEINRNIDDILSTFNISSEADF